MRRTTRRRVLRIRDGHRDHRPDTLAVEEPLEIRVGGRPLTVTMRTPGDDFDLIAGFLLGEGVAGAADDIATIRYCPDRERRDAHRAAHADGSQAPDPGGDPGAGPNIVDVLLADGVPPPGREHERAFLTTGACGICGKTSLDSVRTAARWSVAADPLRVPAAVLRSLPARLRAEQAVFDRTGGLHAAGLFTGAGDLLCAREDIGRHNAVDKVLGWALLAGRVPLRGCVLQVSGRASFELAQKAVMAGVPVLSAVSAPSSLAVDLAAETGLTLAGFVRGASLNVYAGEERVT